MLKSLVLTTFLPVVAITNLNMIQRWSCISTERYNVQSFFITT